MRLTAILADDEPNILRNLQGVIPWDELGIDIVGTGRNGLEAYELCERFVPDLVMSDIRMPHMDGIAFIHKLREINEECKVLMVTGYQDFEYVRSLLRVGVSDYILKPIDYEELEKSIRKLASDIRERKRQAQEEQRKLGELQSLVYEKVLQDVILNDADAVAESYLPIDRADFQTVTYLLAILDVDKYSEHTLTWSESERKAWNFAARKVLHHVLAEEREAATILQMREGEWALLLPWPGAEEEAPAKLETLAAKLQQAVNHTVDVGIRVGYYESPVPLGELSATYRKLQRDLQLTQAALLPCRETRETADASGTLWDLVAEIVAGLKQVSRPATQDALQRLQAMLEGLPGTSTTRAFQMLHYLILHVLRELREMNAVTPAEEEQIWRQLDKSESIPHLVQVMTQLVAIGLEGTNKKKNSELLMAAAKEYIRTQYSNDFGIEDIAGTLGISASYFSLLFKQHFGETFVEYLTKHRMEIAKSLLLHSDKSITDIGRAVGYLERRYFTKVFQKFTGEIPSEYREKRTENGSRD